LQYTSRIAPRGLYTSGKGSTAAGLTATVLREKTTGEYYLEAGALVIADGGVACIDEIDKMREEDRSAIHEALEQQTVSIAKAGIVARLNARASVLAAGNPKFGRYDLTQPVSKNIDLPPTILSRFDLIFVIQDIPNRERDRLLAKHILEVHSDIEKARPHIDPQLLKKYVSYARRYIRPQLTLEAKKLLEDFYVSMRMASLPTEAGKPTAIAITPRQLEALIRLTEAHAKMALKQKATEEDAQEAIRLTLNTLVKVGYDIESKTIDIDILETGISAARREKIKALKSFMDQLLDEVGEIERNELIKKAVEKGFDRELVLEQIQKLIQSGEYYMPRPGKLSRVK
jgi:Predicted ATPase involved in replication control, Cdc46/Mcm family